MDDLSPDTQTTEPIEEVVVAARAAPKQGRIFWRVARFGCLGILLLMCGTISGMTIALQSGPIDLALPFDNIARIGSDDFVLSNYSFQDGNTYYLDLNGNGTRNILQLEYLEDSHSLQLTLHHSTKTDNDENQLLQVILP